MRRLIPLGLVMVLLTGCETVVSDVCPTAVTYSAETQRRAAAELESLPVDSAVAQMIIDYGILRSEVRACDG